MTHEINTHTLSLGIKANASFEMNWPFQDFAGDPLSSKEERVTSANTFKIAWKGFMHVGIKYSSWNH